MPRYSDEAESLVERLAAVRQNITTLNDQMKQVSLTRPLCRRYQQLSAGF